MANERGKAIDNTHLSIDQAEERGFIHRDYIAHCLRWSHVAKHLQQGKLYDRANILDIGCGREVPLAKLMYSSRLIPTTGSYLGIDYNALTVPPMFHTGRFPITLISGIFPGALDEVQAQIPEPLSYDVITCFEVAEHVEPEGTLAILRGIKKYLSPSGFAFISTPCYDEQTGAAANHVNEMSYNAFGAMIEYSGLKVEKAWGTFASIKDYKFELTPSMQIIFDELRDYYDVNYLATLFAPMFPQHSRNCLWKVSTKLPTGNFADLATFQDKSNSSSDKWTGFIKEL
jgi:hypothetical protein